MEQGVNMTNHKRDKPKAWPPVVLPAGAAANADKAAITLKNKTAA